MSKLKLLRDLPIGESDATDGLGFQAYATALARAAVDTPGPFTFGVFGEWGSGKTSLLRLIEKQLKDKKPVVPVWFNAWRYEPEDQPIVPLVATIVQALEKKKSFGGKAAGKLRSVVNSLRAVAYGFSAKSKLKVPGFAEIEAGFVAKEMIDREAALSNDPLLDRSIMFDAFQALSNASNELPHDARIVVLIDDLDRCLPPNALRLLESIKLVLAQPRFVFFLAVSHSVVEEYLAHRYKTDYGMEDSEDYKMYLHKIVQLPFHIPPHHERMEDFWDELLNSVDAESRMSLQGLGEIILPAVGSNPRAAVRFVNNLLLDGEINRQLERDVPVETFAVSRSVQQRWPSFYRAIARAEGAEVAELQRHLAGGTQAGDKATPAIIADLANVEDLLALLRTRAGREWLGDSGMRQSSINFLASIRNVSGVEDAWFAVNNLGHTDESLRIQGELEREVRDLGYELVGEGAPSHACDCR